MRTVLAPVRRHPLIAFFVLAYALTWSLIPIVSLSPLWGFPTLFGPALAAIVMVAVADGRAGLKDLLSRVLRSRLGCPLSWRLRLRACTSCSVRMHLSSLVDCRSSISWFSS